MESNSTNVFISCHLISFGGGKIIRVNFVLTLAIIFMIITCIGLINISLVSGDVSSLAKTIMPNTVLIQTYEANGKELGQGSGFFISEDGDIATCAHVMKGFTSAVAITPDQKKYQIKGLISADLINDLAIVSSSAKAESRHDYGPLRPRLIYDPKSETLRPVTEDGFNGLKLNTTIPEVGQDIIVIGTPLGLENTVSQGIVSAIRDDKIQITAPISPGSSGSPVLNMKGEVIGMVSSQMSKGQNLNFAVPAYLIQRTLAEAWSNKAWDLFMQSKFDDAIEAYNKANELDLQYVNAWINKGLGLELQGKHDESVQAEEKAIELNPQSVIAWNIKGNALSSQGKYDEAIKAYDKAIELDPKNASSAWNNKGITLNNIGKHDEAIQAYNKAIELTPNDSNTWNNKAKALKAMGRAVEAEAAKAKELGYKS